MSLWKDLLQTPSESIVLPYLRGNRVGKGSRSWSVSNPPREEGWYTFEISGRNARVGATAENPCDPIRKVKGFLVGDRVILDTNDGIYHKVHLVEAGLERFARVEVGPYTEGGPLFFVAQDMPWGVEDAVNEAFLEGKINLEGVKGVPLPLHLAFLFEVKRKVETERRRAEVERRQREEEERLAREERQREVARQGGTAATRRELARTDFEAAAKSALALSGAELIETRASTRRHEKVVRFRWLGRRFECTCHAETLQIIDAGVCLTAEYHDDEWDQGTKGDQFFTLESLPGVIREADSLGRLVVFRHI